MLTLVDKYTVSLGAGGQDRNVFDVGRCRRHAIFVVLGKRETCGANDERAGERDRREARQEKLTHRCPSGEACLVLSSFSTNLAKPGYRGVNI